MLRSEFLRGAAALLAAGCLPGTACAQPYPTRPIRLVVPHPPGVGVDLQARLLAVELAAALGQPVVVDNRPGVGTLLSAEVVAKAKPDGYTVGLGIPSSLAAHPRLFDRPILDVERELAPVGLAWTLGWALFVHADVPAGTLGEFVTLARNRPGTLTYATNGVGSFQHLTSEWLSSISRVRLRHIPYGTRPWTTDLLAGRVDAALWSLTGMQEHVHAGRLRLLAVSMGGKRARAFPDVPTFAEAGVPGFDVTAWAGMVVPAGTPAEVVGRLNAALHVATGRPAVREGLARDGGSVVTGTPEQFAEFLQSERVRWRRVIAEADIHTE